jgi:hypothetical protein
MPDNSLISCKQSCSSMHSTMAPMEVDGQTSSEGLFTQCSFAVIRNGGLDDETVAHTASWS